MPLLPEEEKEWEMLGMIRPNPDKPKDAPRWTTPSKLFYNNVPLSVDIPLLANEDSHNAFVMEIRDYLAGLCTPPLTPLTKKGKVEAGQIYHHPQMYYEAASDAGILAIGWQYSFNEADVPTVKENIENRYQQLLKKQNEPSAVATRRAEQLNVSWNAMPPGAGIDP